MEIVYLINSLEVLLRENIRLSNDQYVNILAELYIAKLTLNEIISEIDNNPEISESRVQGDLNKVNNLILSFKEKVN